MIFNQNMVTNINTFTNNNKFLIKCRTVSEKGTIKSLFPELYNYSQKHFFTISIFSTIVCISYMKFAGILGNMT